MLFLSCPSNESLLEQVSIAKELPFSQRLSFRVHRTFCSNCRTRSEALSKRWQSFFQQEPDLTPSLLRVYSQLRKDETLVIKGWKLDDPRIAAGRWQWPLRQSNFQSWVVGGGAISVAAALTLMIWLQPNRNGNLEIQNASAKLSAPVPTPTMPYAQIRLQDKNRVQVHYVQPELLHTIEFETTNQK